MVIQAQQQCLQSIRDSEASAAKANSRADAAEAKLAEVQRQLELLDKVEDAEKASSAAEQRPAEQPARPTPEVRLTAESSLADPSESSKPDTSSDAKPQELQEEPVKEAAAAEEVPELKAEPATTESSQPSQPRQQLKPLTVEVIRVPDAIPAPARAGPVVPGILQPGVVPRALTPQSPRSPAWSNKSGSVGGDGEEFETRKDVKTLFVQCFKDDLIQERQLLMSQINNLFKLRNNGEPLQYKEAGYEKLHNFLTDIPGLCLVGAGNRMELKLNDRDSFERCCGQLLVGRAHLPVFDQPKPVPESFQHKVIEVFRRCGSREIPAKNFRDLWNCFFPHEKLQCKDYGYRDVKGLLANIPVVEKVGGKNSTKYVLKSEVEILPNEQDSALKLEGDGYHWEVPQEPAPIGGALAPQRLDLAVPLTDFGAGEVQPSVISTQKLFLAGTGLNDSAPSPTQATASDAAARGLAPPPRQGQAPGRWAASQAWNDLSWPAQEPSASSTTCASVTPFFPGAAPELPQPYPSLPMNVPTPAPALRPPQPLPMQQQLLDLQHSRPLGQPLAQPSDPRFVAAQAPYRQDVATDRAEELIRLQQEVQTRLLQEQQRQQQLLDAMSHPAATHHPSAQFHLQGLPLPQEQFQQPLLQPQEHLGLQYFNRPPGENQIAPMQPSGADDEAGSVPQELNPGKITPDAGLHLDLLMRETSAVTAMQMRASRLDRPRKSASAFVTSPATIRQNDEETIHQSKFDVGSLYQGHLEALQNDRNCMLVHFANGRILFSNACCDRLFSPLTPLRHREVTEIIAEEDRVNFSSRIMYLSIGKYSVMQREQFKIITAKGVVPANIFGEHLMGSVWWMDCELVEDEDYQSAT
ncbi:unnamed protein product [Symbiodinium sp. CCMP2456]|nr:unnamed protein product [Symbiodinium sp. CCMP2456]